MQAQQVLSRKAESPQIEFSTQHMEKTDGSAEEQVDAAEPNVVYDNPEEEPALHLRTWTAVGALFFLNLVQVFALQGPPSFLGYIGADFDAAAVQTWIPVALSLVQTVLAPVVSSASDTFQARKSILIASCAVAFVGSAIAPRSATIYQVIAAQSLIGVGMAAVPLAYVVPSEILPRRWRPMTQAAMNVGACLGGMMAPVVMGLFSINDRAKGWRNFYWVQTGLWALSAAGLLFGYRPLKRKGRFGHLSFLQKVGRVDLVGCSILALGMSLVIAGLNLGGGLYPWSNSRVLVTMIVGGVTLVAFGLYERYGTQTGFVNHELFRGRNGRTMIVCIFLIVVEALVGFSYLIFFPALTLALFEQTPMLLAARQEAYWVGIIFGCLSTGYASTKLRTIRGPMGLSFVLLTGGTVGFATIQPKDSTTSIAMAALTGLGSGGTLILTLAATQLCTPHHLLATSTALVASARGLSASAFTAVYSAAVRSRLGSKIPAYVARAAVTAGLLPESLPAFTAAFLQNDATALQDVPGITPVVIQAATAALLQAQADSFRTVFIIAAPFGVCGFLASWFLGGLRATMNYRVDAPAEELHAKHQVTVRHVEQTA
ncbi:uncharacterized protein PV06_09632 [Exophiala oligosperma]|uniref:Major facilitator superfamily (MFS) profile domain-containing protein n=1 Tax=Exophiala oligosperma TaxID=215243 RepID=A0A0D2BML9_9EURO|nr:uncharacterized protein PV06_09632 [Exophiala oligosperma]KIW38682.1 hypothetical protein PV06_09632 [Exophiala oligosperma]